MTSVTDKWLNDYLLSAPISPGDFRFAEHIKCADGVALSVQASRMHYCTPRDSAGPWFAVEVGYPSVAPPDSWAEYFDGDWEQDDRTGSVYGYVPISLVVDFINDHGGVA